MNRLAAIVLSLLLAATAGACAAGGAAAPPVDGLLRAEGWARANAQSGGVSAAYLTITNGTAADEVLLGASSPVAGAVEIHRTTTIDGVTRMQPAGRLPVGAGEMLAMAPGGTHVMLIGLTRELVAGDVFEVVLTFERAGAVTVAVEVRAA